MSRRSVFYRKAFFRHFTIFEILGFIHKFQQNFAELASLEVSDCISKNQVFGILVCNLQTRPDMSIFFSFCFHMGTNKW